jgi:hypothetical protein
MNKIVVPTKFNKSGKRVLKIPVDDKRIYAPAHREYTKKRKAIRSELLQNLDYVKKEYVKKISHCIASYLANDSVNSGDRYKVAKFIVEQCMIEKVNISIETEGIEREESLSSQLGKIPELARIEEEYQAAESRVFGEEAAAIQDAGRELADKKRALQKELRDHIHRQFHPEDKA